jgi:uncharacterized membrane-anchored protein YhcB (DUF1043 family)
MFAAALDKARTQLESTQAELQASIEKNAELYKTVRVEHRKAQRLTHAKKQKNVELEATQRDAEVAIQLLDESRAENQNLKADISRLLKKCTTSAHEFEELEESTCLLRLPIREK